MGSLFQSAHMQLVQIIERNDAARIVVAELGERGIFQFRDMNSGVQFFKRAFSDEVRRCDDIQRRLLLLKRALDLARVRVAPRHEEGLRVPLVELDSSLAHHEVELKEQTLQLGILKRNHNSLREQRIVLEVCGAIYQGTVGSASVPASSWRGAPAAEGDANSSAMDSTPSVLASLISNEFAASSDDGLLQYIVGVMPRSKATTFERVVFRATRGNCMVHNVPVDDEYLLDASDPKGESFQLKSVVLVFFSGAVLRQKLNKICTFFGLTRYSLPELAEQRRALTAEVLEALAHSAIVLDRSVQIRRVTLQTVSHQWAEWQYTTRREKMTFNALNMCNFDIRRKLFVAEGWVAVSQLDALKDALEAAARKAAGETSPILNSISTSLTPPTYIPCGKVTSAFQALVDTYGVPKYREVNPGVFAVILFPLLFGLMFGDVGHGLLLVVFALSMIVHEQAIGKRRLDDIGEMCFGGRYILLLNGLFAMYVGTLYNECFAVPMDFFGSRAIAAQTDPSVGTYPWGIDPIWHHASNKIGFFNSYKMKMSIIVGVLHMFLGICLSLVNHLEFKSAVSVAFQFIPEVVFFLSIFGYLVFMIVLKWMTVWPGEAPMLLNVLINMFMAPGKLTEPALFEGQAQVQLWLLGAAFLSVPFLLLPKPLIGYWQHRRALRGTPVANYARMGNELPPSAHGTAPLAPAAPARATAHGTPHSSDEEEEYSFTDEFVHQVIHTIEFVLGSISNTASYLRLWALSLAHSQLSELFWEKIMVGFALGLSDGSSVLVGGLAIVVFTFVWAMLSLAVLMCMENLSSFLHALRLQWVEFQNKFYSGTGHAFVPFSYATIDTLPIEDEPQ